MNVAFLAYFYSTVQCCHSRIIPKVDINVTVGEGSNKQLSSLSLSLELFLQDGVQEEAIVGISTLLVQLSAKHLSYNYWSRVYQIW